MPVIVEVPNTWIATFLEEPAVEDAEMAFRRGDTSDRNQVLTWEVVQKFQNPISRTKRVTRVELEADQLDDLQGHANWYAYYWGEAMASSAWEPGERLAWSARGRGSRKLAERLAAIPRP